jgi:type I restriction enzyme S subunit
LIRSDDYSSYIESQLAGGIQKFISLSILRSLDVPLPPIFTEQTAIATILSDMDAEIESLESKLAKAREIKQGMMQELLTGRIRLV